MAVNTRSVEVGITAAQLCAGAEDRSNQQARSRRANCQQFDRTSAVAQLFGDYGSLTI